MSETDKRFHVAVFNDNTVRFIDYKGINDLISISFKEHKDAVDCRDALMYQCNMMNELYEENEQLKQANERICDDIDLALGFIRHKGYSLQDIKDYGDAKKEYEENLKEFRKGDLE